MSLNVSRGRLIQILLMGFVFFIPISTALMNLFLYLSLILIIVNKNFIKNIQYSWNNITSKYSTIFFILIIFGSFYSIANYRDIIEGISTYKKFIFIILILPYLVHNKLNKSLINTFIVSMGLILTLVYSIHLNIIDPINIKLSGNIYLRISEHGGFKTHIITNMLFAFSGFLAIHKFIDLNKIVYLVLGSLTFYYAIFINDGTTGQILSISLLSVLIVQKFKRKSFFILPLVILGIFTYGATNVNTSIYGAIEKIHKGVSNYNNNLTNGSINIRMLMAKNGLIIVKQNPWMGTGTGSISQAHILYANKLSKEFKTYIRTKGAGNPHSEYLSILIQFGIFGLALYLFFIYKLFDYTKQLPNNFYVYSAQGLLVFIVIGSIGTPIISDSGEGHFIMIFIAILFAPLLRKLKPLHEKI